MSHTLSQYWDLDSIFAGGSQSAELVAFLEALETDLEAFRGQLLDHKKTANESGVASWSQLFDTYQQLQGRVFQAGSFVGCLNSQNTKDQAAKLLQGRIQQLDASLTTLLNLLNEQILSLSDAAFEALLQDERIAPIAFRLQEYRRLAKEKLPSDLESLAADLAVDGYHAYDSLYSTLVSRMSIPFEQNETTTQLSVGQAENRISSGDRSVREHVFANYQAAWADNAELFAHTLNHLGGFRLNLYRHRGWDSVLKEPLDNNRMTQQTLDAMWNAINSQKERFVAFLQRKAKVLGLSKLSWFDLGAPLSTSTSTIPYEQGAAFVVEQFGRFSSSLADFAQMAFEKGWVESEDRNGKRPGAFCTGLPLSQESRIFMTYSGTPSNLATLAHELGHGYHSYVMRDLPMFSKRYPMNLAETASTFAEMIVADAALKMASTDEERIVLLEDKIRRSVTFFMNIHARFLFETEFYEQRKQGPLSVERLNELMENAQKTAYCGALDSYHPHFWAAKLHFYKTGAPFYNFPYTFGYLFSSGIYAHALAEGPSFAEKYVGLLRDTGRMTVEELASKHLGVDLTQPDFWQAAVALAVADVEEFLRLTE